jgi:hypothetical protein
MGVLLVWIARAVFLFFSRVVGRAIMYSFPHELRLLLSSLMRFIHCRFSR